MSACPMPQHLWSNPDADGLSECLWCSVSAKVVEPEVIYLSPEEMRIVRESMERPPVVSEGAKRRIERARETFSTSEDAR